MKRNIIYIRTSTEEQSPQLQLNDCLTLLKGVKINRDHCDVVEEKKSAFKDDDKRTAFNDIVLNIKKRNIDNLIVWDWDRLYRNRIKLKEFIQLCKVHNCKLWSCRQKFINQIQELNLPKEFEFLRNMMIDNLTEMLAWVAQDESQKKSERIKLAVRKQEGEPTKSFKGNKWGRREIKNKKMVKHVLELHKQGLSFSKIAKKVKYSDKNNNMVHPSTWLIWRIVQENKNNTS